MRIPLRETFVRAAIRKRLWMGAGAIAVFIGTLLLIQCFIPGDPYDEVIPGIHLKCDFIAFYTGGRFVLEGHSADLYNTDKVHEFETKVFRENGVEIGSALGPWWNPPFYAWVFVPIARLSYPRAVETWVLINVLCAAIAATVLAWIIAKSASPAVGSALADAGAACSLQDGFSLDRALSVSANADPTKLPRVDIRLGWKTWALVPVFMVLSTPFIHALSHAQNTCTSLLLVTMVVVFWRKGRAIAAGLVTGLLFYKPQLGAVLAAVLVLNLGWRTLIGISITGVMLLLASLALPGSLNDFLHQMPKNLHFVQCDAVYMWDRHVTYKAFWRLLLQGTAVGEPMWIVTALSTICSAIVAAALLWAIMRVKKGSDPLILPHADAIAPALRRDRLIAATIAATPLLMPFYFDYDQLLLAIPAVLFAADLMRRDRSRPLPGVDLWLLRLWPIQYAWLMLNPDIAIATHFNLGVILLTGICGLLIARAGRDREATGIVSPELTRFESRLVAA